MYCAHCGKEIENMSQFCRHCGKSISNKGAEPMKSDMTDMGPIPAHTNRRLVNHIVDLITGFVIAMIFSGFVSALGFSNASNDNSNGAWWLIGLFIYYFGTEFLWGKTFGKLITRTSVVNIEGKKPTWQALLGRTLCRIIPFEVFSFSGERPRGWHDSISGTYVVEDKWR